MFVECRDVLPQSLAKDEDSYRPGYLGNISGFPGISVPMGFTKQGLPLGLTFFGLPYSEPTLLGLAYAWFQESICDQQLQFIGLDIAEEAVNYAVESQLIASGISTNLEKFPLLKENYNDLQDLNILISTGCIGYITERTLDKILAAVGNLSQLWGAVFILKMFDLSEINKTLAKYNLVLVDTGVTATQRKFSSVDEKQSMINFIEKQGLSAELEKESDNLLAKLFLILPSSVTSKPAIKELLEELRNISD